VSEQQQEIVDEIRRVASGAESLTQNEFEARGRISLTKVRYHFGSWNQAIVASGLGPIQSGMAQNRRTISDEEYLFEILRLSESLGRPAPEAEMSAKGRYSVQVARKRWGSWSKARDAAFALAEMNDLALKLDLDAQ
jgi:hypothetical protein